MSAGQRRGVSRDRGERTLLRLGLLAPFGRPVIRVHVIRVVLPHRQHEPDVSLPERVHIGVLRARQTDAAAAATATAIVFMRGTSL